MSAVVLLCKCGRSPTALRLDGEHLLCQCGKGYVKSQDRETSIRIAKAIEEALDEQRDAIVMQILEKLT